MLARASVVLALNITHRLPYRDDAVLNDVVNGIIGESDNVDRVEEPQHVCHGWWWWWWWCDGRRVSSSYNFSGKFNPKLMMSLTLPFLM